MINKLVAFAGICVVAFLSFASASSAVAQIAIASGSAHAINAAGPSSTQQIGYKSFQYTDSKGNLIYVTVYCFYNSSSGGLTFESIQQISAAPSTSWEIDGGIDGGGQVNTNSWSVQSTIEDPSYSPNPPSSANPTSTWGFSGNGFLPIDQPNNEITWGQSSSVTVTTGITVGIGASSSEGATTVGGSLTQSYSVSYTWNTYAFMLEPVYQSMYNDSWWFSDNQGQYNTPYSATSIESASIYAVNNNYNHVWVRDWGQFVYFTSQWDWYTFSYQTVPTFDVIYINDGFTTPYIS